MKQYLIEAFDTKRINVTEWTEVAEPKGIVQIVHGMAEHSLRYDHIAKFLNKKGYIVFANDHRGHGDTDPSTLGNSDSEDMFSDTIKDLVLLNKTYKEKYNLNIIILGHSYGSFLTERLIERYPFIAKSVILSGVGYMKNLLLQVARFLSFCKKSQGKDANGELFKKLTFDAYNKKFKDEESDSFISSLKSEKEKYYEDKYCGFVCSNNFYQSFFRGINNIYKKSNLKEINKNIKILIISGFKDPVGDDGIGAVKLKKMYNDNDIKNVEVKLYPNVRHEIFNDTAKDESFDDVLDFLNQNIKL